MQKAYCEFYMSMWSPEYQMTVPGTPATQKQWGYSVLDQN